MTPSASRIPISRPSAPGSLLLAALTAALAALCWVSAVTAPCARADERVFHAGRITGEVGAQGAREPRAGTPFGGGPGRRRAQPPVAYAPDLAGPGAGVPVPGITPATGALGAGDPSDAGSAVNLIVPVAVLVAALLAALYASTRRRRRTTIRTTPAATGWGGIGAAGPQAPLPLLDARTAADLVDTDDAVRTSEEELGVATAQFGEEAVAPFAVALDQARAELAAAFRLRQRLDDGVPEDEAARRRALEDIVRRCADAHSRLDAVTEDFDRLRGLEHHAARPMAAAESAFSGLAGRVAAAEATLGGMAERYRESATAPAADDLGRARERMAFAATGLDQARTAVDGGAGADAAVYVRAAEGAIGQATALVVAVRRRAAELAEAAEKLPGVLTGTESDLAEAAELLEGTPEDAWAVDLRARTARAQAVLDEVDQDLRAGRYDPVDALRRAGEADTALDAALTEVHELEHGSLRARTLLDGSMLTARAAIGAAADYISTNRGAVGSRARTRLAEARRKWRRASGLAEADDPRGALAEARHADALAVRARTLAEQDVRDYLGPEGAGGPYAPGDATGGAVLGGILLGGLFGGNGGPGEGFGGGPGSFGGGGTRGRRGGGGRF
ncbi:TPM domain-containing protein [Streptomyces sp. NPDC020403]|uniref:TPM domain-containing protein n=1 Tax=unclassified Streptomyces TaxID=2593676 RepID=UPI0033C546A2